MAIPRTVCSHVTVADPAEVCDMNSGECSVSGCKDGPPAGEGFTWSGPGCRVGKIQSLVTYFIPFTILMVYRGF